MNTRVLLPLAMAALTAACDSGTSNAPVGASPLPSTSAAPMAAPPRPQAAVWPFVGDAGTAVAPASSAPVPPTSDAPQALAELLRRNYYVVFDASGSMQQSRCSGDASKLVVAKQALLRFASRLPADANVGLHVFDGHGVRQVMPLGPLEPAAFEQSVDAIRAGGGTPLAKSAREAYGVLTAQGRQQFGYGEYHLIIVTDGEATGEDPRGVVNRIVAESPVLVNTIGFCLDEKHSLNQPGRTIYRSADNPAALEQTLADVLAEAPSFDIKRFEPAK